MPGVRVVGDLTGVPLLKFSADTGARAVQAIVGEADFQKRKGAAGVVDLAIVGGGVSGIAAAIEAEEAGLSYVVFEASAEFSTIVNFPTKKPIFTYPTEMTPAGSLQLTAAVKEALLDELESQRRAHGIECRRAYVERVERRGGELLVQLPGGEAVRALRVIIAIGRSGNYRTLGVPGEKLDKVFHRLYDPKDYAGKQVLVVGGGDSALETAIALGMAGAAVTHRLPRQGIRAPQAGERRQAARAGEGSARRRADRRAGLRAGQHRARPQHDERGRTRPAACASCSAASSTRCAPTPSSSPTGAARGRRWRTTSSSP